MRIVFMGTSQFAVPSLKNLIMSGFDVELVVTQPDRPAGRGKQIKHSPVKELALEFGLDIVQPESIRSDEFYRLLKEVDPDVIVVVAYGRILPEEILKLPPYGCVNLHGSLLPYYRGAAPIQRAIMAGETKVGVTTMYMDRNMDTGDIILQKEVELNGDEDYGEVSALLAETGAVLLQETLEQISWGTAPRVPQNHALATYAPPLTKEDEWIQWSLPARDIKNQIRGLSPQPGASTHWRKEVLKIYRAQVVDLKDANPGEIIEIRPDEGFVVSTGENGLLVQEVQRPGKKRISAAEFIRGSRLQPGEFLGLEEH